MVRHYKIKDENGKGSYSIFTSPDFEYVDPTQHYAESYIVSNVSMMREIILLKNPPIPLDFIEKYIHREAIKDWFKKLKEIEETEISENLLLVLKSTTKKEQVNLLKGLSITPDQLIAFIFKAWTDFGFSFSQYTAEHHHAGFDRTKMPKVVEIRKDKVHKIGKTSLTDGQLKQTVDHRKYTVSKFLDNGKTWHCLFLTFDSLKGKESWKDGQAHYHYISDKFGIPRDKVVQQLKSNKYHLGSLPHIDLIDYRDDKDDE